MLSSSSLDPANETVHGSTEKRVSDIASDGTRDARNPAIDFASYVLSERPNVKWDDVAGLDAAKDALKAAAIQPPPKGILLYGPPGTGRSLLAKAVAAEGNCMLFAVSASHLVAGWRYPEASLVTQLFAMARANKPTVIFIDDVDQLWGTRRGQSEATRRLKIEFLAQMNAVKDDNTGILVLGASNVPWELDNDIGHWFEKRIYTPLPDAEARTRILQMNVGDMLHQLTEDDFYEIGSMADGYTGADIVTVVRDALMRPVRHILDATHFKPVDIDGKAKWTPCLPSDPAAVSKNWQDIEGEEMLDPPLRMADFVLAIQDTRPSVTKDDAKRYEAWTNRSGSGGA
ncbi:Vps4 in the presence of Atpgammas [Auricularia subglabra TFB-10046 SS5]|nr:Vps4 in the presence of Atpgammas [Auricularia subglabra TFB-10046 SS5]